MSITSANTYNGATESFKEACVRAVINAKVAGEGTARAQMEMVKQGFDEIVVFCYNSGCDSYPLGRLKMVCIYWEFDQDGKHKVESWKFVTA